jgi:hypothetical protein
VTAGDLATGLNEAAESCLSNYEEFSGATIGRTAPETSGEFTNILITCDLAAVFLEGLRAATADGAELTPESFIAGVEQIQGLAGAYWDTLSYSAEDHTGAATVREIEWDAECPCWTPVGDWMPSSDVMSGASSTGTTATEATTATAATVATEGTTTDTSQPS